MLEAAIAASAPGILSIRDLNFFGGAFVAKETQDDADGFFSDGVIDTGLCDQSPYQFVHIAPPSNRLLAGYRL